MKQLNIQISDEQAAQLDAIREAHAHEVVKPSRQAMARKLLHAAIASDPRSQNAKVPARARKR